VHFGLTGPGLTGALYPEKGIESDYTQLKICVKKNLQWNKKGEIGGGLFQNDYIGALKTGPLWDDSQLHHGHSIDSTENLSSSGGRINSVNRLALIREQKFISSTLITKPRKKLPSKQDQKRYRSCFKN
jgi:hypothetical protein